MENEKDVVTVGFEMPSGKFKSSVYIKKGVPAGEPLIAFAKQLYVEVYEAFKPLHDEKAKDFPATVNTFKQSGGGKPPPAATGKFCPNCKKELVIRKSGAGKQFLGCDFKNGCSYTCDL